MKISAAVLTIACLTGAAAAAKATWLSGGFRTMHSLNSFGISTKNGFSCRKSNTYFYCPFVSDSTAFFGGDSVGAYVDYNQDHVDGYVTASACRQSFTGSAYVCAPGNSTYETGELDVAISGFANAGAASVFDYFFVVVTRSGANETLYNVRGFSPY